jgi:hypothetical protein
MRMGRGPLASRASAWRATWLAVALVGTGCTKDPGLTQPLTTGAVVIESFVGTLAVGGSAFYSFTVPHQGTVTLTLLSLTIGGAPSDLTVSLGLGVPSGTACRTTAATPAAAGIAPQSSNPVTPSVYCVNVSDSGSLTAAADFAVNITRPK